MPTLEEKCRARLLAFGTTAGSRIYPLRMPQKDPIFPLIVYQRISGPRIYVQEGDSQLIEPRIQWSCWASSYDAMVVLSDQVKAAFSGWKDEVNGIHHSFVVFELDEWEETTGLYRKMLDSQIGYRGIA
jgi:Fe2+ transport system protein FeoA